MSGLPVSRVSELSTKTASDRWLIEGLWAEQAVGILGGEPKCCKSFFALDMAVSVASGHPCLGRFPVRRTGPVLLFPAEDPLPVVRERIEGICKVADVSFADLALFVITAPRLLLDVPQDRQRLRRTVAAIRPRLLILDPFIRLHRADENVSKDVAPLLGHLRELQREFHTAVLLVHHARKGAGKDRPGQALRGSSDLHGWGDSNLYLRRRQQHLCLSVEHRAAPSPEDRMLRLLTSPPAPALALINAPAQVQQPASQNSFSPSERILQALAGVPKPVDRRTLRDLCRMRSATLGDALAQLTAQGRIAHGPDGYRLSHPRSDTVSFPDAPIDPSGNGNGKPPPLPTPFTSSQIPLSGETQAGSAGTQPAQG